MGLLVLVAVVGFAALWAPNVQAARVLVLGRGHHVSFRNDPFLMTPAVTPPPAFGRAIASGGGKSKRTVWRELARLRSERAITTGAYLRYRGEFAEALGSERRLRGSRARELRAVIDNVKEIAAAGLLTASRLPALFVTLDANRQWWTRGQLLSADQRVELAGSELVWEYYPGQGIELQVLGSFAKADGMYTAGLVQYPQLGRLLGELIPLAAWRGGGLTWEYYFHFDGGSPPWTSAMSQGTALEALTRGFEAFGDHSYLDLAQRALPIFAVKPPLGVAVQTARGTRYLQYSFVPGAAIINAFLQALIGLFDYAQVSHDARAAQLFAAGDAEARAEVPRYDTGAWSLYQPGEEDALDYHNLVTGFLQELCARTAAPVYCGTAQHFTTYLKTRPVLRLLTGRARAGSPVTVRFDLSKYSHVGIVIVHGGRTVFLTSGYFGYGTHSFAAPSLRRRQYTIRLAATDLAGNFEAIVGTLQVSRGR